MMTEVDAVPGGSVANDDRAQHVYVVQALRVPAIRLAGFTMATAAVTAHNHYVLGEFSPPATVILTLCLLAYCAGSWIALHFYYRHGVREGAMDLGWIFHLTDIGVCALCVYASGGEQSWLFFLLLVPIWNQTYFSVQRAVISALVAAATYFLLLLFLREFEHRTVSLSLGLFWCAVILSFSAYCIMSAAVTEQSRGRHVNELRSARSSAEQRAQHLAALNRMTRMVTSTAELEPMLDSVAAEILSFVNASSCAITMLDATHSTLEVVACRTRKADAPDVRGFTFRVEHNPACKTAIASGAPVIVGDPQTSPLTAVTHEALRALGVQCLMSVPIVSHGEAIGTVSIHTDDENRMFTNEEALLATMAAGQVAAPIRNAQLYQREKRSRQLAERLQSVGRAITQSLDLGEVLPNILGQVSEVIDFDAGSVQLVDGNAMRVVAVRGYDPTEVGRIRPLGQHPYNKRLSLDPDPIILDVPHELWQNDAILALPGAAPEVRSVLGVPLIVHDQIIGAMSLESHRQHAFSDGDAQAAMAFARFAAMAVEHARLYASMHELSIVDPLTRVANRRHLERILETEWRRALRAADVLSIVMIDVDDFKKYNDHYGHPAGDVVLQLVASSLSECLQRSGDFVARYGGEEFVVLLPSTDALRARHHAETLRHRVEQRALPHIGSARGVITISVGVCSVVPAAGMKPEHVLEAADRQLYMAKGLGRNRVCAIDSISGLTSTRFVEGTS